MIFELPFGAMAWLGVVVFQALLHYAVIIPRRRKSYSHAEFELLTLEEKHELGTIAEEEECNEVCAANEEFQDENSCSNGDETPQSLSPCLPAFGDCDGPIEEEPRQIRQLLNQTGSELVNASPQDCHSMTFFERLAKEQLQQQYESVGNEEPLEETWNLQTRMIDAH